MKILITGATGDIGKNLSRILRENNFEIKELVRKKEKSSEVKGDLRDLPSLEKATKNINLVIHLAGLIRGNKEEIWEINTKGTKNLVLACKKNNVKKIIFLSSLDIKFNSEYGKSKLKAEKIIEKSRLKYIILRPSVVYERGFRKDINSLVKIIKKSPVIPVMGKGENLYQPLYVKDLCSLILKIIQKNKFENKNYFVCGKEKISMNDLIEIISSNLSKKIIKIHLPIFLIKMLKIFNIDCKDFTLDKTESNENIKKDFDFKPIGIKEGIKKLI